MTKILRISILWLSIISFQAFAQDQKETVDSTAVIAELKSQVEYVVDLSRKAEIFHFYSLADAGFEQAWLIDYLDRGYFKDFSNKPKGLSIQYQYAKGYWIVSRIESLEKTPDGYYVANISYDYTEMVEVYAPGVEPGYNYVTVPGQTMTVDKKVELKELRFVLYKKL